MTNRVAAALLPATIVGLFLLGGAAPVNATTLASFSTAGTYTWTVPSNVTKVTFDVFGASGGDVVNGNFLVTGGGPGGEARETFKVRPGQVFEIVVGGKGDTLNNAANNTPVAASTAGETVAITAPEEGEPRTSASAVERTRAPRLKAARLPNELLSVAEAAAEVRRTAEVQVVERRAATPQPRADARSPNLAIPTISRAITETGSDASVWVVSTPMNPPPAAAAVAAGSAETHLTTTTISVTAGLVEAASSASSR